MARCADPKQPHQLISTKPYSGNYPRAPVQVARSYVSSSELQSTLTASNQGFWILPVTKGSLPLLPELSLPSWNPEQKDEEGKPQSIVWSYSRLRALWTGLNLWINHFGGLTVDCYFEEDHQLKQGDHIRLRCEGDMALCLRDALNSFHCGDNQAWIRKRLLLWCSPDGRAIMAS
jgi:hypothetical protein